MDLSALIFVALAVAWAVYLIPKALRQHEDGAASRSIDRFSTRMRVLARREPVDARTAALVVPGRRGHVGVTEVGRATEVDVEVSVDFATEVLSLSSAQYRAQRAQRASAVRAAKRRLRVVCVILLAIAGVGLAAFLGYVGRYYAFIPVGVLLAWLVACRLMVKRERSAMAPVAQAHSADDEDDDEVDNDPLTEEIAVVMDAAPELPAAETSAPSTPGGWEMMPTTLPTYVAKEPAARRSVRTIDLDSTGVWSSGASAADSALAREAEEAERADRAARAAASEAARRRASGS